MTKMSLSLLVFGTSPRGCTVTAGRNFPEEGQMPDDLARVITCVGFVLKHGKNATNTWQARVCHLFPVESALQKGADDPCL